MHTGAIIAARARMFRLVTSNDAARLAGELGKRLAAARDNPLVPARVVVPQVGLKRWLQVHLAEQLGVLANVEFTPPAQFAWELLRAAQPGLPERSPFDVEVLRWHLYGMLGEALDGAALAPLREYLGGSGDPLRRYALSLELARVYERMQGYRRERLLAWERDRDVDDDWQAELWRRLLTRLGGVSRAARVDDWLRRFDPEHPRGEFEEKPVPPGLPATFACFACANVSPDVLRMLAIAGRHSDIDFYLPLPSREYLGDTPKRRGEVWQWLRDKRDGNPLVVSQGGALAEFVELLYGYRHVQPDEEIERFDTEIAGDTLLGRVRDDILNHAAPRDDGRVAMLPDDSLQFRACHTPLREVQTLHDALLAMLDADDTLQPRDIAVMLPDIAAYRPAIEAVFGGVERGDPRRLPFNLGDVGATALHPVAQLFLDLLDAPTSRWEADELLDVLAVPGVMRRFDLEADAVERLSRRLREAGVRWGEDEHARADCGGYREYSWAFGIERMLAGFACGDASDALAGDTAPLAGVEGAAFAHLDAVLAVTETWRRLRARSRHAQSASRWQEFLNEVLDGLYQRDPRDVAEARALEHIRDALAALAHDCAEADPALELPWTDVRAFLRHALAAADPRQYLFTGGITFCGMVPLRVVPFRVICLLGMDEAAFPRRESNGLDPLLRDRRAGGAERGDRDVRADDRLLFLQLLAAARDAFYVSWLGRDAHTNEDRPPSTVVSELMDVVRTYYLLPAGDEETRDRQNDLLPRVEPLHPFDARLFARNAKAARSFHSEWRPAANARRGADDPAPFAGEALPLSDAPPVEIHLDDLKQFFDDPARGFLEGALQLRLPRDADEDADLEPLQPDYPLLRYDLAATLLTRGDADAAREQHLLRAQGRLPPGELADAALDIARDRADLLRAAIDAFTHGNPALPPIAASLDIAGTILDGTVDALHPDGLVRHSPGGLRGKRVLRAWLDTLFVALATSAPTTCRFLWIKDGKLQARDITVTDAGEASAQLARMIAAYREGMRRPLPLFPDASATAFKLDRQKGPLEHDDERAEFIDALAGIAARGDDDGEFSDASDFDKPSTRLAWRGVAITAGDAAFAARLHDAARDLFPRLRTVPKEQA